MLLGEHYLVYLNGSLSFDVEYIDRMNRISSTINKVEIIQRFIQ